MSHRDLPVHQARQEEVAGLCERLILRVQDTDLRVKRRSLVFELAKQRCVRNDNRQCAKLSLADFLVGCSTSVGADFLDPMHQVLQQIHSGTGIVWDDADEALIGARRRFDDPEKAD